VPKEVLGHSRYGVYSYIDPTIASAAYDNSSRSYISEIVEFFCKKSREYSPEKTKWRGTLHEFHVLLREMHGGGGNAGMPNSQEYFRRGMLAMEESYKAGTKTARPVMSAGFGGGKIWEIDLSENYDIGNSSPDIINNDT